MLNVCNRQLEQNAVTIADVTDEAIETPDKQTTRQEWCRVFDLQ